MPRRARIESGTGIFHVMMRGINHQNIFEDEEDCWQFINTLDRMRVRYDDYGKPCECLRGVPGGQVSGIRIKACQGDRSVASELKIRVNLHIQN